MKNIFKTLFVGLLLGSTIVSCEDSDLPIDELYDTVDTSGAIVRTLEPPADLIYLTPGTGQVPRNTAFDMLVEVQEGDGSQPSTFTELRVYIALYKDQDLTIPLVDSNGNDLSESLLMTLAASEFSPSEGNGLPSARISYTSQSIVDANPTAVFTTPTFFATRLELQMSDGTIYTNTNIGAAVASGDYFAAPFIYKTIFINN